MCFWGHAAFGSAYRSYYAHNGSLVVELSMFQFSFSNDVVPIRILNQILNSEHDDNSWKPILHTQYHLNPRRNI